MPLSLELAVRFLRRRTGVLLRGTAVAAMSGVALATASMVITLALMNGYSGAIATALQRGNAHAVGFAPASLERAAATDLAASLATVDGVVSATPVTYLTGLLSDPAAPSNPLPVTLKAVTTPPEYTGLEGWPETIGVPVVVGERLAASLGLAAGDVTVLRLPPTPGSWLVPTLQVAVVGTFSLEFAEFDERWMVGSLDAVRAALPTQKVAGIEIVVADPLAVGTLLPALEERAPRLLFSDWREMNRPLFAALKWQTLSLFVVLALVVAVASFQVSSALVVLAIDKRRSAGMLQALGATPRLIRRVLTLAGTMLGGAGVVAGLVVGIVASRLMTAFEVIHFSAGLAQVYMVDSIPLVVRTRDLGAIAVVCLGLVLVASSWPAWKTSHDDPIAALRSV